MFQWPSSKWSRGSDWELLHVHWHEVDVVQHQTRLPICHHLLQVPFQHDISIFTIFGADTSLRLLQILWIGEHYCLGLSMYAMPLDLWKREEDCFTKLFSSTWPVKSWFGIHGSFMTSCIYQTTWIRLNSNFVKCKIFLQSQRRISKHFHWSQNWY